VVAPVSYDCSRVISCKVVERAIVLSAKLDLVNRHDGSEDERAFQDITLLPAYDGSSGYGEFPLIYRRATALETSDSVFQWFSSESEMNDKTPTVKVVVESKNRLATVLEYASSELIGTRYLHSATRRIVVGSKILDEMQKKTVHDAQSLADELGVGLKVEDLSEQSFARRLFVKLIQNKRAPSIELPEYWSGEDSGVVLFHLFSGNEPRDHENVLDLVYERLRTKRETKSQLREKRSEEEILLGV
jgi:hypothetical protein